MCKLKSHISGHRTYIPVQRVQGRVRRALGLDPVKLHSLCGVYVDNTDQSGPQGTEKGSTRSSSRALEELTFVAFYNKGYEVMAVASMNYDPMVPKVAEVLGSGSAIQKWRVRGERGGWRVETSDMSWL